MKTIRVAANGLSFEVATAGNGDCFALLLHGFPEHAYSWRYQMPLLAELGYTVWAPNLRGYGNSDRPARRRDYVMDELLADVAGLIDAAGARQTLLVGHDWGAAIAWAFAMYRTRPLARLAIMNVPHPQRFLDELFTWPQILRSWYIFFFMLPWLPETLLGARRAALIGAAIKGAAVDKTRFPADVLDVYRDNAAQPGALRAMINYYRANVYSRRSDEERALLRSVIQTPTLMLWGEADKALGKELALGTEAFVADLTLRFLPGVSHWVQQEAPATVNAMLRAWLEDAPVPETISNGS